MNEGKHGACDTSKRTHGEDGVVHLTGSSRTRSVTQSHVSNSSSNISSSSTLDEVKDENSCNVDDCIDAYRRSSDHPALRASQMSAAGVYGPLPIHAHFCHTPLLPTCELTSHIPPHCCHTLVPNKNAEDTNPDTGTNKTLARSDTDANNVTALCAGMQPLPRCDQLLDQLPRWVSSTSLWSGAGQTKNEPPLQSHALDTRALDGAHRCEAHYRHVMCYVAQHTALTQQPLCPRCWYTYALPQLRRRALSASEDVDEGAKRLPCGEFGRVWRCGASECVCGDDALDGRTEQAGGRLAEAHERETTSAEVGFCVREATHENVNICDEHTDAKGIHSHTRHTNNMCDMQECGAAVTSKDAHTVCMPHGDVAVQRTRDDVLNESCVKREFNLCDGSVDSSTSSASNSEEHDEHDYEEAEEDVCALYASAETVQRALAAVMAESADTTSHSQRPTKLAARYCRAHALRAQLTEAVRQRAACRRRRAGRIARRRHRRMHDFYHVAEEMRGRRYAIGQLMRSVHFLRWTPVMALLYPINVTGSVGMIDGLRLGCLERVRLPMRRSSSSSSRCRAGVSESGRRGGCVRAEQEETTTMIVGAAAEEEQNWPIPLVSAAWTKPKRERMHRCAIAEGSTDLTRHSVINAVTGCDEEVRNERAYEVPVSCADDACIHDSRNGAEEVDGVSDGEADDVMAGEATCFFATHMTQCMYAQPLLTSDMLSTTTPAATTTTTTTTTRKSTTNMNKNSSSNSSSTTDRVRRVHIHEINAACGALLSLLECLAAQNSLTWTHVRLHPRGERSTVQALGRKGGSHGSTSAVTVTVVVERELDFYIAEGFFVWRSFGTACVAVARCVRELCTRLAQRLRDAQRAGQMQREGSETVTDARERGMQTAAEAYPLSCTPPYSMSEDRVDGLCLKYGAVKEEVWTLAMKRLLANVQWCVFATWRLTQEEGVP